jgi:hypothetical protein
MWTFYADNLTSLAMIDKKSNTLTLKIYGFENMEHAELFAQFAMMQLNFEYYNDERMQSKMIH